MSSPSLRINEPCLFCVLLKKKTLNSIYLKVNKDLENLRRLPYHAAGEKKTVF
jgi:hypothetical protein